MTRILLLPTIALLVSCADVPLPYELDHARIMAVRIDPPSLGAGERATIDVLATDGTTAHVADPASVEISSLAPLDLTRSATTWILTAPSELPGAIVVPLDLTIELAGETLTASKTVALGPRAANPPAPTILQDGVPAGPPMQAGADTTLTVDGVDSALSYRWFSSVGSLTGYTRASVELDPDPGSRGQLGVVVRDQAGGTSWTIIDAEVTP